MSAGADDPVMTTVDRDVARHAVIALAAGQHRALTRRQATAVGFDSRRVATAKRAGWLAEPLPGVLTLQGVEASWARAGVVGVNRAASVAAAARRIGLIRASFRQRVHPVTHDAPLIPVSGPPYLRR